ncbi:MAG: Hpt domain-containing protein, partial [Gammaproteobacteria bacterium]|nr:Hpt domain-containing protein [Gammaproteobacteria bacterium]
MSNIDLTLLPDFIVEASEHLDEMEMLLLRLVDNPADIDILNEVFRPAHTIKGAAQFMGIEKIAKLTHRMEDLLDQLRSGERESTIDIIEILIAARDRILLLVSELERSQQEESEIDDLIARLNAILDSADEAQPAIINDSTEDLAGQSIVSELDEDLSQNDQAAVDLPAGYKEEEDDKELFEIFSNHLQQQVTRLVELIAGLEGSSDKGSLVEQCIDTLNKLRSSANYMGFEDVGEFYQDWIDALSEAAKSLILGRDVAFSFMDFYLGELKQNYPQIDYSIQVQQEDAEDEGIEDMVAQLKMMQDSDDASLDFTENLAEQSSASQSEAAQPTAMDEESDQELLDIYLKHLQQQVTQLISLMFGLGNASDQGSQVDECIASLSSLRSSANYMGYDEVAGLYRSWIDTLGEAKKSLSEGRDVAFSFMDFFLGILKQNYPQIDYSLHDQPQQQTASTSVEATDSDSDVSDLEAILQASAQLQEEDLFGRLTQALDGSIHQVSDTEYETLNGVYDEIVSSNQEDAAEKAAKIAEDKPKPDERRKTDQRKSDDRRLDIDRRGTRKGKQAAQQKRSLRVDSIKIDSLMNQVGELVVDRSYFVQLLNELGGLQQQLKEAGSLDKRETKLMRTFNYRLVEAISALSRTSNDLQEG